MPIWQRKSLGCPTRSSQGSGREGEERGRVDLRPEGEGACPNLEALPMAPCSRDSQGRRERGKSKAGAGASGGSSSSSSSEASYGSLSKTHSPQLALLRLPPSVGHLWGQLCQTTTADRSPNSRLHDRGRGQVCFRSSPIATSSHWHRQSSVLRTSARNSHPLRELIGWKQTSLQLEPTPIVRLEAIEKD